jgi:predicted choloylglycine hydrolase
VNSNSPSCKGLTIERAGKGLYRGAIEGMNVVVKNSSGQKKWIQADIKYTTDIRSYYQNSTTSWWETTQQLVTYESGTFQFWVRTGGTSSEKNLRMLEVKVTGCGA